MFRKLASVALFALMTSTAFADVYSTTCVKSSFETGSPSNYQVMLDTNQKVMVVWVDDKLFIMNMTDITNNGKYIEAHGERIGNSRVDVQFLSRDYQTNPPPSADEHIILFDLKNHRSTMDHCGQPNE